MALRRKKARHNQEQAALSKKDVAVPCALRRLSQERKPIGDRKLQAGGRHLFERKRTSLREKEHYVA